jgi:hypothetical protein
MPRYYMRRALAVAIWTPSVLAAQVEVGSPAWRTLAADTGTKLLLEHRYVGGTADSASVRLVKDGYYWIELSKSLARPVVRRVDGNSQAFVSPSEAAGREGATLFELYPGSSGVHILLLESGRGLGIDLGIIRQSLPDVGYGITWYIL